MARSNFENLQVYQLAEKLADAVWDVVAAWGHLACDTVGKQLIRAADSIGVNIAEGCGRAVDAIRPLIDELAPRLNAYLKSIGPPHRRSAWVVAQFPRTTDN